MVEGGEVRVKKNRKGKKEGRKKGGKEAKEPNWKFSAKYPLTYINNNLIVGKGGERKKIRKKKQNNSTMTRS